MDKLFVATFFSSRRLKEQQSVDLTQELYDQSVNILNSTYKGEKYKWMAPIGKRFTGQIKLTIGTLENLLSNGIFNIVAPGFSNLESAKDAKLLKMLMCTKVEKRKKITKFDKLKKLLSKQ